MEHLLLRSKVADLLIRARDTSFEHIHQQKKTSILNIIEAMARYTSYSFLFYTHDVLEELIDLGRITGARMRR